MIPEFDTSAYFLNLLSLSVLVLPLYYLVTKSWYQRLILSLCGIYLVYFIAPRLVLYYFLFWLLIYVFHLILRWLKESKYQIWFLWGILLLTLSPMLLWKIFDEQFTILLNLYTNLAVGLISEAWQKLDFAHDIIIIVGLSFNTFRAVDLLVKTYLEQCDNLSLSDVIYYGFFPPVLIVGPIIEYAELTTAHGKKITITAQDFLHALVRIFTGVIKVYVIAFYLKDSMFIFDVHWRMPFYLDWLYLFIYAWFFYMNFSGYSDISIGVARLFGIHIKENFNSPFFKDNPTEFWNNWHISLSRFAQRNAFIPLGGFRENTQYIAIFGTMMVIALWHGLSAAMIVFGVYHSIGLIMHRIYKTQLAAYPFLNSGIGRILKKCLTHIYVVLSFPLLALSLADASAFYLGLIGLY